MFGVVDLAIVEGVEKRLGAEGRLPLHDLSGMGAGRDTVPDLSQRGGEEGVVTVVRRRQLAEGRARVAIGAGAILGQSEYAGMSNAIYLGGKGEINVIGSTPDQPAVFGFIDPTSTGPRDVENGAKITVGSGQDAAAFNIVGGQVEIKSSSTGQIEIKTGTVE